MSKDYEALGFKAGVEIHQQLEGKKLFCDCKTINSSAKADIKFERKLRALAGETGVVDQAAQHEMKKNKRFVYQASSDDTCLVEFDEEPPRPMNIEALKVAFQVSKLLNAHIVDEIQIMRKTVVDGSNVSGFQRTALVAYDGYIETSKGKVLIPDICLEEEAARKIGEKDDYVEFRLDRLGIPLIEVATGPDIKDPEHTKEVAEKLGLILRSTGKVKRGIGTIRQDVNISIKGGSPRIEIKGFQDLKSIPSVMDKEIDRQLKLIKKGEKLEMEVRKAESDGSTTYLRPMPGAARMYPETDVPPIVADTENIETPELIFDKEKRYIKMGISKDLAKILAKSPKADWFDDFSYSKPAFIAESLISVPKELYRKHEIDGDKLTKDMFKELFDIIDAGKAPNNCILDMAVDMVGGTFDLKKYEVVSGGDLEKEIKAIVEKNKQAPVGAIMGQIMAKFHGKVDGKQAMELVKKYL